MIIFMFNNYAVFFIYLFIFFGVSDLEFFIECTLNGFLQSLVEYNFINVN